jgi:hypothetical protein
MPLRDHFHPPLKQLRHWESFHARWINAIADAIDDLLPAGYVTEPEVHAGVNVEIDVGTFRDDATGSPELNGPPSDQMGTAVATLPKTYIPPAPTRSIATAFADDFEIRIFRESGGLKLVAAIELVSPGNQDDAEARRAFATKCASYLHNSVAVIVIDTVTGRTANLHDEIVPLVTSDEVPAMGKGTLYAIAYRPILANGEAIIDIWEHQLAIGESLPTLPLWLNAELSIPVELETTYSGCLRRARIE